MVNWLSIQPVKTQVKVNINNEIYESIYVFKVKAQVDKVQKFVDSSAISYLKNQSRSRGR